MWHVGALWRIDPPATGDETAIGVVDDDLAAVHHCVGAEIVIGDHRHAHVDGREMRLLRLLTDMNW
jgi:hypothetical protein